MRRKGKLLLEELGKPVPEFFRDVARKKIAGKIGELAFKEQAESITEDSIVRRLSSLRQSAIISFY
jgi:hypothetical protein